MKTTTSNSRQRCALIVLPDVNFLVAATIVQHEFHRVSRRMLIEEGGGSVHVALLTEVVSGYVRVNPS